MAKPRLTLDEHKETADILKRIYLDINSVRATIDYAYPQKSRANVALKKLSEMHDALLTARHEMEEQMALDIPDVLKMEDWKTIYYGSSE